MDKDYASILRQRFLPIIQNRWIQNNHQLKDIPCVYAILEIDWINKKHDIAYIGSTIKLFSRYKSHKIPEKIQAKGMVNVLYYLPMNKGFYDYEIKLIRKLKPEFNKAHKNG